MTDPTKPQMDSSVDVLERVLSAVENPANEDLRELVRLWESGVTDEVQLTSLLKSWKQCSLPGA